MGVINLFDEETNNKFRINEKLWEGVTFQPPHPNLIFSSTKKLRGYAVK